MRATLRQWATRVLVFLVLLIISALVGQYAVQIATDKGYFVGAGRTWDRAVSALFPWLYYAVLIVGSFTAGLWTDKFLAKGSIKDDELKEVSGKHFQSEVVPLDGMKYIGCTFNRVRFTYNGGRFALERNTIVKPVVEPLTREGVSLLKLMFELGLTDGPVADQHGIIERNTKFRGFEKSDG